MAVARKTQKDIGNHEAKFIGPLTIRQTAAIGLGAIPTVFIYFILYNITNSFTVSCAALIFMIPSAFIAFGKDLCYGLNPEDYLIEYYFYHIKSPNRRVYKTVTVDDRLYDAKIKELKKEKAKQDAKKKRKEAAENEIVIPEKGFKKYPHPKEEDPEIKSFS